MTDEDLQEIRKQVKEATYSLIVTGCIEIKDLEAFKEEQTNIIYKAVAYGKETVQSIF